MEKQKKEKKDRKTYIKDYNTKYYEDYLITCDNCGNKWDGYAQCNCYQLECYSIKNNANTEITEINEPSKPLEPNDTSEHLDHNEPSETSELNKNSEIK